MKGEDTYSLLDIAKWPKSKKVILPNVQRGFVWKAAQIENLWDSLLRGFPVGAFVLTPNNLNASKFEILDGQQRATAICLGFGSSTFRNTKYRVFIDLDKPKPSDNREFVFRVLTPSQPWGYQWTDNTETLTAENKRKAMEIYRDRCGVSDPFQEKVIEKIFPYDASIPVPFHFFLKEAVQGASEESIVITVTNWLNKVGILSFWLKEIEKIKREVRENPKSKKQIPELSTVEIIHERIRDIYRKTVNILNPDKGQRIPALYLNIDEIERSKLKNHQVSASKERIEVRSSSSYSGEKELEESDPLENLFIRLNDGGTPLSAEELNYSILKANIAKALQKKIENACSGFLKPARFISIAFRLFQHQYKYESSDGLSLKISAKQFQSYINEKKNKKAFLGFLRDILKPKEFYEGKTLLQYARHCLEFDKQKCKYGLPFIIVSDFADKAPEIMFLYLFRLMHKSYLSADNFTLNTITHRKMLGVLTILMWLGRSERQRNYAQTLRNIWPAAKSLDTGLFWSSIAIQRTGLNEVFTIPPSLLELRRLKKLFDNNIRRDSDIRNRILKETLFLNFIDNMLTAKNRDLVLYGQRVFLDLIFPKEHYFLDDTDVPFDWDHISPNSLVHGLQDMPAVLKQWYGSNGNMRAWPYALNRMDQDVSPSLKLDPLNPDNYYEEELWKLDRVKESWLELANEYKSLKIKLNTLKHNLLKWSACESRWAACSADNLKVKDSWEVVYRLISERNFNLIRTWHDELRIEELIPVIRKEKFRKNLNLGQWKSDFKINSDRKLTRYFRDNFTDEGYIIWLSKIQNYYRCEFVFYLMHGSNPKTLIRNDSVIFGVHAVNSSEGGLLFQVPVSMKNQYNAVKEKYVQKFFTLTSSETISYIKLFKEIYLWLEKFPTGKRANVLPQIFLKLLKTNIASKLG